MRSLALGLLTLSLASCGGGIDRWGSLTVAGPPGKPPALKSVDDGPPPAWVRTARGERWLGYSSFCWARACVDYIPSRCGESRTPTLHLARREIVQFHLGFAPSEVAILRGRRAPPERLKAVRDPTWRVRDEGAFTLFARAKSPGGDASYIACVRLD
jgi:hypothetical protein